MTPIWLILLAVAQALAWLASPPRSLAAAAEREALRRQSVGPSVGSYSNDTLEAGPNVAEPLIVSSPRSVPYPTLPVSEERDELWWRQQVADRRAAIRGTNAQAASLESEIARLDAEAISRDDPAQQALLRQRASDARRELETLRSGVADARRDLEQFLEGARRLNIPPGWLR